MVNRCKRFYLNGPKLLILLYDSKVIIETMYISRIIHGRERTDMHVFSYGQLITSKQL